MDNAVTRGSTLKLDREAWARSRWLYYQQPIRNYLKGLGCPEEDLDDLVHDLLIRLQTYIVLRYDPSRPFRPYLKKAIRSFYFNHLQERRKPSTPLARTEGLEGPDPMDLLNAGLVEYARKVYECFAVAAEPRLLTSIAMLADAVICGIRQEELARQHDISERQVRSHLMRAADALTAWMEQRIHREDLDALADRAQRLGVKADLHIDSIRSLFSYLSREKRTRALLALALIHRNQGDFAEPVVESEPAAAVDHSAS
jgi:DNA-directed RNA polymerase specialized sigma24 family protein